jgi:hypothetical protein
MTATREDVAALKTQLGKVTKRWDAAYRSAEAKAPRGGDDFGDPLGELAEVMKHLLVNAADALKLRGQGEDPSDKLGAIERRRREMNLFPASGRESAGLTAEVLECAKVCGGMAAVIAGSEQRISSERAEFEAYKDLRLPLSIETSPEAEPDPTLAFRTSKRIVAEIDKLRAQGIAAAKEMGDDHIEKVLDRAFDSLSSLAEARLEGAKDPFLPRASLGTAFRMITKETVRAPDKETKEALETCRDVLEAGEQILTRSRDTFVLSAEQALKDVGNKQRGH